MADGSEWWTAREASEATGLDPETFRAWARNGRVRSEKYLLGKRSLVHVLAEDVQREAAVTRAYGKRDWLASSSPVPSIATTDASDRTTILAELARRHRSIEEHHEEIERHHRDIARQWREIEELLISQSVRPEN